MVQRDTLRSTPVSPCNASPSIAEAGAKGRGAGADGPDTVVGAFGYGLRRRRSVRRPVFLAAGAVMAFRQGTLMVRRVALWIVGSAQAVAVPDILLSAPAVFFEVYDVTHGSRDLVI